MNNLADLINAALETLLAQHCELPAFSTLDRMARRIRTLVNGSIYRTILVNLSEDEQQALSRLLQQEESPPYSLHSIGSKKPPKAQH